LEQAARLGHPEAHLAAGFALALGETGDFKTGPSRTPLERAARKGDPLAQACYGHMLVDCDFPKAGARWLRRAAPRVPWAALELATNRSFHLPRPETNRWTRAAAEAGIASAQNLWGEALRDGWGVRSDLRAAVAWFRRAAEQGNPTAQLSLGVCLHEGRGVRRDDRASVLWYRRSAAQGTTAAMNNLGRCYRRGHGVRASMPRAVRWFRRSADLHDDWARAELARIHLEGLGVRKDRRKAAAWARLVVERFERDEIIHRRHRGVDVSPAFRSFGHLGASRRGAVGEAYHVLGVCSEDGTGLARDDAASFRHYRTAAAAGHACATYDVARAYEDGRGVERSPRKARVWMRKAAERGDSRAHLRTRSRSRIRR
jgi:TPR repeat protein